MAMTTGSGNGLNAVINVTPLVDVLLVLLIIFMVIMPMKPVGLEAEIPQPPTKDVPTDAERTVVAEVLRQGEDAVVRINHEQIAWSALEARLTEIYKTRAQRVIFIKGDDDLDFVVVARVIDAANATKLGINVGLLSRANGSAL
jgi:biopolymer transport protein ExbD